MSNANPAFRGASVRANTWSGVNRSWNGASWANRGWNGSTWGNRGWNGWGWGNRWGWNGWGWGIRGWGWGWNRWGWGWGSPNWWWGRNWWWGSPGYAWWGLGSFLPWYSSPWYYGGYASNSFPSTYGDTAYFAPTDTVADLSQQPVQQPAAPEQPQPQPAPADLNAAHIRVIVPPDAQVWLSGTPTTETGTMRILTTPALDPARGTTFDIRAAWHVGERVVTQTRQVTVYAGDAVTVRFQ
jgi:uncharacterized protein (TIGR03000 family)